MNALTHVLKLFWEVDIYWSELGFLRLDATVE